MTLAAAIAFAILLAIFASSAFAGKWRAVYVRADALLTAILAGLAALAPILGINAEPWTLYGTFILLKLTLFLIVIANAPPDALRWSSGRAALLMFVAYVFLVPASLDYAMNGDEPYYLLLTDSIVRDFDLDLSNQYASPSRPFANAPEAPQDGDPTGPAGEVFSRHEPFLSVLLSPGYLVGGRAGATIILAIFGALLARSTLRMMEEEGISHQTRMILLPFFALGPPVLFYSTRIWTEVPAAFFFVESVRAVRHRRHGRLLIALLALCLLQVRFVLVAALLIVRIVFRKTIPPWIRVIALAAPAVALAVLWSISGSPLQTHQTWELMPRNPERYMRGFLGLIFDGAAGFAFQAPIYVLGILGIARWRRLPESARLALFSSVAYLLLLVIRDEWHGGWSPPLRYVVFLTPFLLLSAASVVDRRKNSLILVLAGAWTLLLSIRGIGMPWTLFRIADGENFAGVHLSRLYSSDFSRLFPSLIRPNTAAIVAVSAGAVIFLLYAVFRDRSPRLPGMPALGAAFVCCAFSAMVMTGTRPGRVVHFEDSHIKREGGSLYPEEYTVARFRFHGGWEMQAGDAISFRYRGGRSAIFYRSAEGAVLTIGGSALALPPTGRRWDEVRFTMPAPENRIAVRVISGTAILDRMESLP